MSSEIWVVTGVDDEARGLAHEAASRSGLSTGAWIERAIGKSSHARPAPEETEDDPREVDSEDELQAPEAEPDPADEEMIAALHAIDARIDRSGERLAARSPAVAPAPFWPGASDGALMPDLDEIGVEDDLDLLPRTGFSPRIWGTAIAGAAVLGAIGMVALVQITAGDLQGGRQDPAPTARADALEGAAPQKAAAARDKRIASMLAGRAGGRPSDHGPSIARLRESAVGGDARAQHHLGLFHATGHGPTAQRRRAPIWLHRSAAQGLPEAAYHLGVTYDRGAGVAKDRRKAVRFYRRAAKLGHPRAQHNLAVALATGRAARDLSEAVSWLQEAAVAGLPESQFSLGLFVENGIGTARDRASAIAWYRRAARNGHVRAKAWLRRATKGAAPARDDVRQLLLPLGFDPAALTRVAAIAGGRDRPKAATPALADRDGASKTDTYLLLLGGSLGEIELSDPSTGPNGPDRRSNAR